MGSGSSLQSDSLAQKVRWLSNSPLFLKLSDTQIEKLASHFYTKKYKPNSHVFIDNDQIVVVATGELKVSITLPSQSKKVESELYLNTKRPGDILNLAAHKRSVRLSLKHQKLADYFGEVEVKTCTETTLLVLPKPSFDALGAQDPELADAIKPLLLNSIVDYLRPLEFLSNVAFSKIHVLAEMCRFEVYEASEVIVQEGDKAEAFFIILEGSCDVSLENGNVSLITSSGFQLQRSISFNGRASIVHKLETFINPQRSHSLVERKSPRSGLLSYSDSSDNNTIKLGRLGPGCYFGETALLLGVPRTTTVRATSKVMVLTIKRGFFQSFLTVCPELKKMMMREMISRLLPKLHLLKVPILAPFHESILPRLVDHADVLMLEKDELIMDQNTTKASIFIVIHGKVDAYSAEIEGNKKIISRTPIVPGQVFGEESFNGTRRKYRYLSAAPDTVLLVLFESALNELNSFPVSRAQFNIASLKEDCSMDDVLRFPPGNFMFQKFLNIEHNEENLEFMNAVTDFIEGFHMNKQDNLINAKQICTKYIHENAPKQVNLKSSIRNEVDQRILMCSDNVVDFLGPVSMDSREFIVPPDIFDASYTEVKKLLQLDAFPRFKKSLLFKQFLKEYTSDAFATQHMRLFDPPLDEQDAGTHVQQITIPTELSTEALNEFLKQDQLSGPTFTLEISTPTSEKRK